MPRFSVNSYTYTWAWEGGRGAEAGIEDDEILFLTTDYPVKSIKDLWNKQFFFKTFLVWN